MSRIGELIQELAPAGVRHAALSDVAEYSQTRVDAATLDEASFVGVDNLVADKGGRVEATYLPNTARLTAYKPGDILLGNIRPYLKKVWLATNEGGCSGDVLAIRIKEQNREELDAEFLYYLLSSDGFFSFNMQHAKGAKMPRGNKIAILSYRIPVPPPSIQREIVRILDQFTQLEAELEAELEARRQQYAYFSELLLTPRDVVRTAALGELLLEVIDHRGKTPKKLGGDWATKGHRVVSAINFKGGGIDNNDHHYISEEIFAKWMKVPLYPGDVLLTSEAPLGSVAIIESPVDWAIGQRVFGLRPNPSFLHSRYLFHLLRAGAPRGELLARSTGSTVSGIRQAELVKVSMNLPTLAEQERVADVLDNFASLVGDLRVGLPAELMARRKQYEYYRDKLLTFPEAAS
ncbi:restriction endonuclease subunit S [Microbacterium sp. MYb62]|uniref:restriction endonuclease subunit S n=1 Tax=Microbacterium sp. MYb62 TaxID=1848690 RepID=UPI000CFBD3B0|nr:restriction endonuclease subunit S [Microbacterium sp. MYb62]PRB14766.1 restriction endonuclease subunit S [Microbacterium sp. MYb62]